LTNLPSSWQEVYSSLCSPQNPPSPGIQRFLADTATQDILKKPHAPFEPLQTSQFATITAAINVTPDENGPYDIKQIKGDASWLAEAVHIDMVAALRIVVLEWQKQPAARMLSRSLNEEDSQAPDGLLDISIFAPKSSTVDAPYGSGDQSAKSFDSTYSRQLRLIRLAVSEASYVLAVSELKIRQFAVSKAAGKEQGLAEPIDGVGKTLYEAACPDGNASKTIKTSVDALSKNLDLLGMNGEHPANKEKTLEKFWEDLAQFWYRAHMLRVIGYLQFIFTVADSSSQIPTAEAVLSYFELMHKHDFFIRIDDSVRSTHPGITLTITDLNSQFQAWLGSGGSSSMLYSSHLLRSSD
jgi:nuclear pore complex protein Nup188